MKEPMPECKECTERYLGCHDKCPSYLEYKKLHKEWVDIVRKKKKLLTDLDEVEIKRFEKYEKRKAKHQKEGAYK